MPTARGFSVCAALLLFVGCASPESPYEAALARQRFIQQNARHLSPDQVRQLRRVPYSSQRQMNGQMSRILKGNVGDQEVRVRDRVSVRALVPPEEQNAGSDAGSSDSDPSSPLSNTDE